MKILVSDFDNTFFTNKYEKNIELIKRFVDEGNMFVIATGRNITDLKRDIDGLDLPYTYLICNDGAIIFDKEHTELYRNDIEPSVAKEIFNMMEKEKSFYNIIIDDGVGNETDTDKANCVISRFTDREKAELVLNQVLSLFPEVYGYISLNWLNVTNKSVNKGKALALLLDMKQMNKESLYVVGDNLNDISMVKRFKGYAVSHGSKELMDIAKQTVIDFEDLIKSI